MRSFLFFTLLTLVAAADKDKHKSSSIYETESHRHVKESDESNSGLSESGLSKSPSSSESESEVKVTKKRILVKKKKEKDETVEEKKISVKKVVRSTKFPLQFTTKKPTEPSSSEYDEDATVVDKKVYKDVGYRKDKNKERSLKEKRRDTTTNPNKRKKPKTTQKPTKKRHYTGYNALENASDLNYPTGLFSSPSVPVSPGEDMLYMFTINETVTAILNKEEVQIDHIKAGEILKDLKKKYEDTQKELPTNERSEYVSFDKRKENSIFNNSTLLDSDSGYDDEEYDTEEDDESKGKAKHTKHRKGSADSEDDKEELTTKEKDRRKAAQYSTKEKEERTIQLFNILRNSSNISIPSQERLHHRKIILDTLREQGEDVKSENDIVSHYDSDIEKKDESKANSGAKRTRPKQSTTTTKKGPLWSIEQAYKRAVKSAKNGSKEEHFDSDGKSKGYEKIPLEKVLDKARESRENKKWVKKFNGTTTRKTVTKGEKWTPRPQGSGERKRMKEIKEAPDPRDRKRFDSRERGRGRYGEPRERYGDRGDRGDRYKPRYDSRQRYGDRGRFDSKERGRYGDRGPPRYDRGPPPYERDRYDRGDRYGRDGYRGREERGRYGDKPRYEDRGDRKGYYERREGGRYEGRRRKRC